MKEGLTFFFIMEPPNYEVMACHLAASARLHFGQSVDLVAYCPNHKLAQLSDDGCEVMRRLRCDIRGFEAVDRFLPEYPHGNKILAALEPRDTRYSAFLDSDMLFIKDTDWHDLCAEGMVGVVASTSMRWTDQSIWPRLYGEFGMDVPEERIRMTRDTRAEVAPYFNAGLIVIDEAHRSADGKSFADIWMETARRIDASVEIDHKRPYLDQMSLPIAILRAGARWNILDEKYNYSIGGILRGKPVPQDQDIRLLHYRRGQILEECGMRPHARHALATQAGTRRINWVFLSNPPAGIAPLPEGEKPPKPVAAPARAPQATAPIAAAPTPTTRADPSKADLALVAPWDHSNLPHRNHWLHYWITQIGAPNIYLLGPSDAPRLPKIAQGINRVSLPRDADMAENSETLWQALSHYASGLSLYYNWVITVRADEIIAPHPSHNSRLIPQLHRHFARDDTPMVLAPFGIEVMIPDKQIKQGTLLEAAHGFRAAPHLCKPCISRVRIGYAPEGLGSNRQKVRLDTSLYLMRFCPAPKSAKPLPAAPEPDFSTLHKDINTTRRAQETARGKFWYLGAPYVAPDLQPLPAPMRLIL